MHRLTLLAAAAIASTCTPSSSGKAQPAAPRAAPPRDAAAPRLRPDEHGMPQPIALVTVARVCARAPCSGRFARVEAWLDRRGRIARYVHHGDIDRCSHPPMVIFDDAGRELGGIPLQPVQPGSPEQRSFEALRQKLLGGLVKGQTARCPGAANR